MCKNLCGSGLSRSYFVVAMESDLPVLRSLILCETGLNQGLIQSGLNNTIDDCHHTLKQCTSLPGPWKKIF